MIRKFTFAVFFFLIVYSTAAYAGKISFSTGIIAGMYPSMGGNLDSYSQQLYYDTATGLDGINRNMDGYSTSNIERLTGISGGLEIKTIFYDYYLIRLGANYGMSILGGEGKTVFQSSTDSNYYNLECEYSYTMYDFPLTIGLSIPFWQDFRISLSCGAAFAMATYENKFTEDTPVASERKAKFTGWGIPMVVVFQGDYFIMKNTALISMVSYYRGSSKQIKDSYDDDGDVDYANLDFSGYRINLGICYYFNSQ